MSTRKAINYPGVGFADGTSSYELHSSQNKHMHLVMDWSKSWLLEWSGIFGREKARQLGLHALACRKPYARIIVNYPALHLYYSFTEGIWLQHSLSGVHTLQMAMIAYIIHSLALDKSSCTDMPSGSTALCQQLNIGYSSIAQMVGVSAKSQLGNEEHLLMSMM